MGWRTKEGKKKALTIKIVSKRGSRKVIGACQRHPLSPAARCCSPASQALFSHTHFPENIHRSFLYTTEPATRSLLCEGFSFFSLLIPSPFSPFPFCAPRPSDHRSLLLLKYPGDNPTYRWLTVMRFGGCIRGRVQCAMYAYITWSESLCGRQLCRRWLSSVGFNTWLTIHVEAN